MVVSRSQLRVFATLVAGALAVLTAPVTPTTPTPPTSTARPTVTGSPGGTAPPTGTPLPATAAPPPIATVPAVTLAVTPLGQLTPAYEIQVTNGTAASVRTTVRQELPPGLSPIAISHGGHANDSGGAGGGTELSWQLRVPAGRTETVSATLRRAGANASELTAPACAFTRDGLVPDDCATATWSPPRQFIGGSEPPWRQPGVLGLAGGAALLLGAIGLGFRARRRRDASARQAARDVLAHSEPNIYPKPRTAAPRVVRPPRRRPPLWAAVGLALLLIGASAGVALWAATDRVGAMQSRQQPSGGAWVGTTAEGPVGTPLRESAFEFTVYRAACPAGRPCTLTVGVRNVSDRGQRWYAELQRAYLADGNWVTVDEAATRGANRGHDLFAEPVPPGERRLAPLVFAATPSPPTTFELRSAVFSAGVRVDPS
ncbi:hypothetical protein [Plantactinospora sp. GCM10030261]|uniref:hypothetical protein n=1 Tax=Plantactinospora sp. GCM10030261 TaxID=3273420 RepID=UPI003609BA08